MVRRHTGPVAYPEISFNAALKKLQQWKEAPVDGLALVLFRMAESYHAEIQRGHAGRCLV